MATIRNRVTVKKLRPLFLHTSPPAPLFLPAALLAPSTGASSHRTPLVREAALTDKQLRLRRPPLFFRQKSVCPPQTELGWLFRTGFHSRAEPGSRSGERSTLRRTDVSELLLLNSGLEPKEEEGEKREEVEESWVAQRWSQWWRKVRAISKQPFRQCGGRDVCWSAPSVSPDSRQQQQQQHQQKERREEETAAGTNQLLLGVTDQTAAAEGEPETGEEPRHAVQSGYCSHPAATRKEQVHYQ